MLGMRITRLADYNFPSINLNWHPKHFSNSILVVFIKMAEFSMPRKEQRGTLNTWHVRKLFIPPIFESLRLSDKLRLFLGWYFFDTATAR
jgi:hypothetical protein